MMHLRSFVAAEEQAAGVARSLVENYRGGWRMPPPAIEQEDS
jgi:hypothetical protein